MRASHSFLVVIPSCSSLSLLPVFCGCVSAVLHGMNGKDATTLRWQVDGGDDDDDVTRCHGNETPCYHGNDSRYHGYDTGGTRRKTLPRCNPTKMLDIRNKYKILRSGEGVRSASASEEHHLGDDEDEEVMSARARCLSLPGGYAGFADGGYLGSPKHVRQSSFDPYSTFCFVLCGMMLCQGYAWLCVLCVSRFRKFGLRCFCDEYA